MDQESQERSGSSGFSAQTLNLLRSAGWSPERAVDIGRYVQALETEGYEVFPVVETFLRRFGGLEIAYPINFHSQSLTNSIHFDAAAAAAAVDNEGYVSKYAERIGVPVCVIGEADNRSTTLMMDQEGRVYGGFDDYLSFYGETGEQAIEHIIGRQNIKRL